MVYIQSNPTLDDDYFLSDEALEVFKLEDNISYIKLENNEIIGVITVLKKFGIRLRYAHVKNNDIDLLKQLHQACLTEVSSYKVFLEESSPYIQLFLALGLTLERTVYAFKRDLKAIDVPPLSEGYTISEVNTPDDLEDFVNIRNITFKSLKGADQRNVSFYDGLEASETYIPDGMLILKHLNRPIGIIKAAKEIEDGVHQFYIGPLGILPDYQHKGLGRFMLAYLINIANQYKCICTLSVNTDNENALSLYTDLGFYQEKKVMALI
jgi:ribosomal protein S18 acetylase RimI-like enzyme